MLFLCRAIFLLPLILLHRPVGSQDANTPTTVSINAIAGLQFDPVRFKVKPGSMVKLIFRNVDNMEHNLLITKPGAREKVVRQVIALGSKAPDMDFNPKTPDVLYAIEILAPGEEKVLEFQAPHREGIYPYVCTYSGHGLVMYGAMYVVNGEMPPIKNDPHIPELQRGGRSPSPVAHKHEERNHPYELVPPYLYRIFMPESGPASFAVRLNGGFSYCWDAGQCSFRYAWYGGFLDNSPPWITKGQAMSKILGTVFYRERNLRPIRIGGDHNPSIQFKGYRLVEGGFPEFHYEISGRDVYELVKADTISRSIIRVFRIPDAKEDVFLRFTSDPGVSIVSSDGSQINKRQLSPEEAKRFSVVIELNGDYQDADQ